MASPDASALLDRAARARAAGDLAGVRADLVAAFRAARAADDLPLMARAALALPAGQGFGVHPGQVPAYLHEVLLATREAALRARLLAGLTRAWAYGGEVSRATGFAAEALDLATGIDDPVLTAEVLDAALLAHWGPGALPERVRLAAHLADVGAHLSDPEARLTAHLWQLTTAWECLDPVAVRRQLRALDLLAAESGSDRIAFYARSRRAMHALVVGDLPRAAALLVEIRTVGARLAEADVEAVLHSLAAGLARQRGDTDALRAEAEAFERYGLAEGIASVLAEAAVLWLDAGDGHRAGNLVDQLPEPSELPEDVDLLLVASGVQHVASRTGHAELAARAAAVLEPYAGRAVLNAGAVSFHGVVDEFLDRPDDARAAYRRLGATWWADRLAPRTGPRAPEPVTVHLRRDGGSWTVGREGATFVLPDLRGLHHLHALLERPGVDLASLDLAGAAVHDSDLGPVLDDAAKRAYRRRLADLDAEIDEADDWQDRGRLERALAERQALLTELAAAAGLAGRDRRPGGTSERARLAVRKAVLAAIGRIGTRDPGLARLLRDGVRTGTRCRYEPDPGRPVRWVLRS